MTITHKFEWDMAHRLPLHQGKCSRLHGHRYVAEIEISGDVQHSGAATGMIVDFYDVKEIVSKTIGQWDHRTMMFEGDSLFQLMSAEMSSASLQSLGVFSVSFMPTAENISQEIVRVLRHAGLNVTHVRVYETPNGWADAVA